MYSDQDWLSALDDLERANRFASIITGPAAWVLSHVLLPDTEEAERKLDELGICGTPEGEFIREQVVNALRLVETRGKEWHNEQEPTLRTPTLPVQGHSEAVLGAISRTDAAQLLGVSKERVGQLIKQGDIRGEKVDGKWLVDRASVEARAERINSEV
jgi:excisionase family DNA binding protein